MCIAAAAVPAWSLAVSAATAVATTGLGIYQSQQQAAYQRQQADLARRQQAQQIAAQRAQQQSSYNNAVTQARYTRQGQIQQHMGQIKAQFAAGEAAQQQIVNNQLAANRTQTAEQLKLKEARDKAAFRSQEIYAKQIGAMGRVMAMGQTGQSIGAIARDVNRQAGFAEAKEMATLRSAGTAADMQMQTAQAQLQSANNQAWNSVPSVQAPFLTP